MTDQTENPISITIKLSDGCEIQMTIEEAKNVYGALHRLFFGNPKNIPIYPNRTEFKDGPYIPYVTSGTQGQP